MKQNINKMTFNRMSRHYGHTVWTFILALTMSSLSTNAVAQKVKQDNTYRIGKLKNGLTYYIKHNSKEPRLASFYLAQRVGSILEEPRQRGLAHFLEHMAFNGTEHFRGDSLSLGIVPWCERIGVKFGTNLNAYTSVDQTVYNVSSVPLKREGIIDSTLLILHDWSHSLLLTDKEIDKERGVIHEEWRTRRAGMAIQRMMENVLPTIYQGTKYADCLPIGSMDIVDHFPYQALRDYYQKWYRPDLQAVIVVGDVDVDKIEHKIKKLFGSIPMPKHAAERIYYPVSDNKEMIIALEKDTEQPIMLANLYMKYDATPDEEKNLLSYQRDSYISKLINYMLNIRLQDMQQQATPPFLSASVRDGNFFVSRTKGAFSLSFGCKQEDVRGSFNAAIGAVEQVKQKGFTADELERAKAVQMKVAQRHFKEKNDRGNRLYVSYALRNFLENEPLLSAETNLEYIKQFDSSVTLEEVNKATSDLISDSNQVLIVYAPDKKDFVLPSKEELKQYVISAQKQQYDNYKTEAVATVLMANKPAAGKIVKEESYGKFGVTKLTLSNGIEVYVKPTTFNKDQINIKLWGEGGTSLYSDEDAPSFGFITSTITDAGVGNISGSAIRKMLASKIVKVKPIITNETQGVDGSAAVKDAETMFQLAHLYFTAPRKDSIVFAGTINKMRSFLKNREANPQVIYNDSLTKFVYGDSPRIHSTKLSTLDKVSFDRIYEIYNDRFKDATGFKMTVIGNIDMDKLRPLLCQYIATLPAKGRIEKHADTFPKVRNVNETHVFKQKMNTPSALVNIIYTFQEPVTAKQDLAIDIFKRVLTIAYTVSVREEQGGTYGVSVKAELDKDSNPSAFMKISFRTDPNKYDTLLPIIYKQIEDIAKKGPDIESIKKAKEYLKKSYHQATITNDYWNYILYNDLRNGIDYDTNYLKLLDNIKAEDVQKIAKDILKANRRIEVTMISE